MRQGMYGLSQAVILDNKRIIKHLSKYDYVPSKHTTGMLTHSTQPVTFVLTVDGFSVKYVFK